MTHFISRTTAVLALMVSCASAAPAQTTILSTDNEGLFRAPIAKLTSMLTFKSDDTSVRLSVATPRDSGTAGQLTYGADLTVKSSQGLGAVIKNGTYTPGTKINGYALRHSILTDVATGSAVDWLTVQGTLSIAQQDIFDGTQAFGEQLQSLTFKGGGAKATYALANGWYVIGGTGGWERTNNYSDMKDATVVTSKTYVEPTTGATRLATSDQKSVKQGSYAEGNIGTFRFDAMLLPSVGNGRIGVTLYENNRFSGDDALRRYDVGTGIALLKEGSPTTALGSLVVELKDYTNVQGSTKSLGRRVAVSLQGSIPIAPKFGF